MDHTSSGKSEGRGVVEVKVLVGGGVGVVGHKGGKKYWK